MKYDIQLVYPDKARRQVGTSFTDLSVATRFALRFADEVGRPEHVQAVRYGNVQRVLIRQANMTVASITVIKGGLDAPA